MPLPQPRKGTEPPTAKVKPSRREQLMAMAEQMGAEQRPAPHTINAIERAPRPADATPRMPARYSPDVEATLERDHGLVDAAPVVGPAPGAAPTVIGEFLVTSVRPSPFQPRGRPSAAAVEAVEQAIAAAGTLEALVSPDGGPFFTRLDPEAARLAELAYDIAEHDVRTPIELRTAHDGAHECLAGHRRLAAARLAGRTTIPAIHRGRMSNATAAATVLRGNLHRENFTTWQEAVLVTEVQERRRADGYRDTVRSLGAVMGWSHGKVNMLLRMRRALSSGFLATVSEEAGEGDRVEEALARAPYRDLQRLVNVSDDAKRVALLRRMIGVALETGRAPSMAPAYRCRATRTGGFVIEVHRSIESLDADEVAMLREALETQLTRVRAREASLR